MNTIFVFPPYAMDVLNLLRSSKFIFQSFFERSHFMHYNYKYSWVSCYKYTCSILRDLACGCSKFSYKIFH